MLNATERAVHKMKQVVEQNGPDAEAGIRVAVLAGGCSGFQYSLKLETAAKEGDEVMQFDGLKLYIDEQSSLYLDGTEIDYEESWKGEGFRFKNPNVTGTCGCGESFSA